ncbi:unnamed protein product [Allacma fusca]|uniref:Uncharacterized protein n=1 Tax=Allacma fusca TaxID=39272 RepID=A0A8J2JVD2_9HEXA|nr:unnamed protein product [Allacma fusca]
MSARSYTSERIGMILQDQNGNLLPFIHPKCYPGSTRLQESKKEDSSMQPNAETSNSSSQFPSDDIPVQPSTRKYSVSQKVHLFSCFKLQSTKPKTSSRVLTTTESDNLPKNDFRLEEGLEKYRQSMDVFVKTEVQAARIRHQHEKVKEKILQVSIAAILKYEKFQAYIDLESHMNCQLIKYLPPLPSTFGIFITENRIVVGTISSEGDTETLCDISGFIQFHEDNIIIGTESTERNALNLFSLISSTERSTIMFGALDFTFSAEEMLTLFFLKLFEFLQEKISEEVKKAIIVMSFTISSAERKKVERASRVFNSVTVVSTVFVASLDYAKQTGFFLRLNTDVTSKFILALQYSKNSFLIALLELGHNFVYIKRFVNSSQVCGNFSTEFLAFHEKAVGGESLSKKERSVIHKVYSLAVKKVCKRSTKRSNISGVVVTNPDDIGNKSELLLEVLKEVLSISRKDSSFENIHLSKEPLRIASLWAFSSVASSAVLPADVDVYDISNLLVSETLGSANVSRKCKKVNKGSKLPADFKEENKI